MGVHVPFPEVGFLVHVFAPLKFSVSKVVFTGAPKTTEEVRFTAVPGQTVRAEAFTVTTGAGITVTETWYTNGLEQLLELNV